MKDGGTTLLKDVWDVWNGMLLMVSNMDTSDERKRNPQSIRFKKKATLKNAILQTKPLQHNKPHENAQTKRREVQGCLEGSVSVWNASPSSSNHLTDPEGVASISAIQERVSDQWEELFQLSKAVCVLAPWNHTLQ
jgi:hypothetical protein